ncbi:uncharacterized protein LOC135337372 [Halichondria panicea]|uniref:uncharacterized protein LOC135337372 n=1 Tax=Halichondria panicea TaxID=6063 RepID=UPI00312B3A26
MADKLPTRLQDALIALEEGNTDTAISIVTGLKPQAAKLCTELEQVYEKLTELEESIKNRGHFLSHHVKVLGKKERELKISQSISESIQHTQHKKLQATKWQLMKARNALFMAKKKLTRKENELSLLEKGMVPIFWTDTSRDNLKATVQKIQCVVDKLNIDCSQKEKTVLDTQRKIAELKHKFELKTKETQYLRELYTSTENRVERVRVVKVCVQQAIKLWTLCKKAFDNGHKREDVLKSIAGQANEICQFNSAAISSSRGLIDLLQFTPQCLLCCKLVPNTYSTASFKCEHCLRRDDTVQTKVKVQSFTCTEHGYVTGTIRVCNLAYDKQVLVRYSQNGWKISANNEACYKSSSGELDQFQFQIPFNISLSHYLEFAVCYRVSGGEFWDNNEGRNYRVIL